MIEVYPINTRVLIVNCEHMEASIRAITINEFSNIRYKCVYWHANEMKEVWLAEDELKIINDQTKSKIGFL